jgi:hypothetical protein
MFFLTISYGTPAFLIDGISISCARMEGGSYIRGGSKMIICMNQQRGIREL